MTNLPAVAEDVTTGLEDVDITDFRLPMLKINHVESVFEDTLDGSKHDAMKVVILGLVKQRVMWDTEIKEEAGPPLCKSFDHKTGFPSEAFPWDQQTVFERPADVTEANPLPCQACPLKEWGSHPTRQDIPWCTEQHTFIVMVDVSDTDEPNWAPALLTVQRSSMKASNAYLSSFARSKTPMFKVFTTITLEGKKRGTTRYAVVKFAKGEATPNELWPTFGETYLKIRSIIQTPRVKEEEEEDVPKPTRKAPTTDAKTGTADVITVEADDDDEVPF